MAEAKQPTIKVKLKLDKQDIKLLTKLIDDIEKRTVNMSDDFRFGFYSTMSNKFQNDILKLQEKFLGIKQNDNVKVI